MVTPPTSFINYNLFLDTEFSISKLLLWFGVRIVWLSVRVINISLSSFFLEAKLLLDLYDFKSLFIIRVVGLK